MSADRVTVFGGTGFLGSVIVEHFAQSRMQVRVATRHASTAKSENVERFEADVRDEAAVSSAVAGASAVVNAVGLYVEHGEETCDAVHVQGARHVAKQAKNHGATRLVHISGIGVDPASRSRYVRARAEGEFQVREAFDGATIIRPSVLFGPNDAFLNSLDRITARLPVIPLFGTGQTRLQPVYVEDVAEAAAACIREPSTAAGTTYELGGAEIYTYREVLESVLRHRKLRRVLLPMPFVLWEVLATLLSVLATPPVTFDQIELLRRDNVVPEDAAGFRDLHIVPKSLGDLLPHCLGQ